MHSLREAMRAVLASVAARKPNVHTLKLICDELSDGQHLHNLLGGFEQTNDSLHPLHFAPNYLIDRVNGFYNTTPETDDLPTMLYTLPSVFSKLNDVIVNDAIAVPDIARAKAVIRVWVLHWQKLGFENIHIGILYVNVDFSDETNLNALRAHVVDVLPIEHALECAVGACTR